MTIVHVVDWRAILLKKDAHFKTTSNFVSDLKQNTLALEKAELKSFFSWLFPKKSESRKRKVARYDAKITTRIPISEHMLELDKAD